jgi:hypothetical protein
MSGVLTFVISSPVIPESAKRLSGTAKDGRLHLGDPGSTRSASAPAGMTVILWRGA